MIELITLLTGAAIGLALGLCLIRQFKNAAKELEEEFKESRRKYKVKIFTFMSEYVIIYIENEKETKKIVRRLLSY